MRKTSFLIALALVPALAAPAAAQTAGEEQRWEEAQARYREETDRYERERDLYMAALERARDRGRFDEARYETEYDAALSWRSA